MKTNVFLIKISVCLIFTFVLISAQSDEKIVNGSFELGSKGWIGNGSIVTMTPYSGAKCLEINDNSDSLDVNEVTQNLIPVSNSKWYNLSLWFKGNVNGQNLLLAINQYTSTSDWILGKNIDITLSGTTNWQQLKYTIRNLDPTTTQITLTLRPAAYIKDGSTTGKAWFDNVSLLETSTPKNKVPAGIWLYNQTGKVTGIWCAPSAQKIYPGMSPVSNTGGQISIDAAIGESESFQIILSSSTVGNQLTAYTFPTLSVLLPSSIFSVKEVAYVNVVQGTDASSITGSNPDPLPNLILPFSISGTSPIWVTIKVPYGTAAGTYSGNISLTSSTDGKIIIPFSLRVYNFELPKQPTLRSSYGLDLNTIDSYQHLGGIKADRRTVFKKYLKSFADYKICPQDILGDDQIPVSITDASGNFVSVWNGGELISSTHSIKINDDSTNTIISACSSPIKLNNSIAYTLTFKAKRYSPGTFLFSVNQLDGNKTQISGNNKDFSITTTNTIWNTYTYTLNNFNSLTRYFRLVLYATAWSDNGTDTGTAEFDDIVINPQGGGASIINETFQSTTNLSATVQTNDPNFTSAAQYALGTLGFNSFRITLDEFANGFGSGNIFNKTIIGGNNWNTPGYNSIFAKILFSKDNYFKTNGWLNRAYAYWYDEPDTSDYDDVINGMRILKNSDSHLNRLLTVNNDRSTKLNKNADIWVPLLSKYEPNWASQRIIDGGNMWWYVCCDPTAPYTTNFIDHPGIEQRLRYWLAWQNGIKGDLYWSVNYYQSHLTSKKATDNDPWTNPSSYSVEFKGPFGNGDGRLLYPPRNWNSKSSAIIDGPVPSIRLELIRDGIEDYEYFVLLKKYISDLETSCWYAQSEIDLAAVAKTSLAVPTSIATSLISYTDDIAALLTARKNIALKIEDIRNHLSNIPVASQSLPTGWTFSADLADVNTKAIFQVSPVVNVTLRNEKPSNWSLERQIDTVSQGDVWTFTAVVGGRNVGSLVSNGFGCLGIESINSSGQVVNLNLGTSAKLSGTFGWTTQSVTVTIPAGITYLRPRFYGYGAGEYYVAYSVFTKSSVPAVVPDFTSQSLAPSIKAKY